MRRQSLVASAVLTAALALGALPGVAGSETTSRVRPAQAEALQSVRLPASEDGSAAVTHPLDAAGEAAGHIDGTTSLIEPGTRSAPTERTAVVQPVPRLHAVVAPERRPAARPKPVSRPRLSVRPNVAATPRPKPPVKKAAPKNWKRVMTGLASWYDNGTTAMRLPPGTHIKICGARACVTRVVRDWGPARYLSDRIVDLTPQDFVAVTGRSLAAGLAPVKVYIY